MILGASIISAPSNSETTSYQVTNENHDLKKLATTPNDSPQTKNHQTSPCGPNLFGNNKNPRYSPFFSLDKTATLGFTWRLKDEFLVVTFMLAWRFHVGIKTVAKTVTKHIYRDFSHPNIPPKIETNSKSTWNTGSCFKMSFLLAMRLCCQVRAVSVLGSVFLIPCFFFHPTTLAIFPMWIAENCGLFFAGLGISEILPIEQQNDHIKADPLHHVYMMWLESCINIIAWI